MLPHPLLTIAGLVLAAAPTAVPSATATAPTAFITPATNPTATPTASVTPTDVATPTTTPTAPPDLATVASLSVPATVTVPGATTPIPWPTRGHAQLEVAGIGSLGRSGSTKSVPIASITKVMTAYLVLRDHPLTPGVNGPTIVVSRAEADSYARRRAEGESLVKVKAGERITERKALQGMLIASGNNMADILARWDAGSVPAFVQKMNANAALLGLTSTRFADPSGLSAKSRSTTADLLTLAPLAMADRTFAKIVSRTSATIPLNKIKNTNTLLGRHGVIGIKTGTTRAAGGCLLFATRRTIAGHVVTIYGALLGAPGPTRHANALAASDDLIVAARKSLRAITLVPAGRDAATVTRSDGTVVHLVPTTNAVTLIGLAGETYTLALPAGLTPGQVPTTMTARTATRTISIPLTPTPIAPPIPLPTGSPDPAGGSR